MLLLWKANFQRYTMSFTLGVIFLRQQSMNCKNIKFGLDETTNYNCITEIYLFWFEFLITISFKFKKLLLFLRLVKTLK